MTEERIQELAKWFRGESGLRVIMFDEDMKIVVNYIRTIVAEARKEGIREMCDAAMGSVSFGIPANARACGRGINRQINIECENLLKNQA